MSDSFYITLNSNASSEFQKQNNASYFKTHFGQLIEFSDNWECALVEIKLPMTIKNVQSTYNTVVCTTIENSLVIDKLTDRNYGTPADFMNELNKVLKNRVKFSLDKSNICHLEISKMTDHALYFFPDQIKDMLGLRRSDTVGETDYLSGCYPVNINKSLPSVLYVNTNIIKHQIVDNTHTCLLRAVPTMASTYKYGYDKIVTFEKLHYKPLALNRLEYMEIGINTPQGENVSFDYGHSSV
jgi:hypothetical protein